MKLGIDVDGVLYDWDSMVNEIMHEEFGYRKEDARTWDHHQERFEIRDWSWLWDKGVTEKGLFRHGGFYPGALNALNLLVNDLGHEVHLISSCPKNARLDRADWVKYHRLPVASLLFVDYGEKKSKYAMDAYLDDNLEIADDNANTAPSFLWDRAWNQDNGLQPHASKRVYSWHQFIQLVERLKRREAGLVSA